MRKAVGLLAILALLAVACGQPTAGTSATDNTIPEATTSTTELELSTTSASSSSRTAAFRGDWTVARYGTNPSVVMGERGELGSGCSPGTDLLPDGIWFGWIDEVGAETISFDLACLWPGRLEPAASNDAVRIRVLPRSPDLSWYSHDGHRRPTSATNAPGLPETLPYWIFINEGLVTEVSEYPEPVAWARSEQAWSGLGPGCCDGGDVAPPSPTTPWPNTGWPDDGFYAIGWLAPEGVNRWFDVDIETGYEVMIGKWIACSDNPGACPDWWTGAEVTSDPAAGTIDRTIALDRELTVVIMPIMSTAALVCDGEALSALSLDIRQALADWVPARWSEETSQLFTEMMMSPEFPFGVASGSGSTDQWPIGYRAPGGTHVTWESGWLTLEIRNGQPILYIHAGLVAG